MAVIRELWRPRHRTLPAWPCPTCQVGGLALSGDSLKVEETGASKRAHAHEAWEPEWIEQRFSCLLVCQNGACGEITAASGIVHNVEVGHPEAFDREWVQEFEPRFLYPAPPIFAIPTECPDFVRDELGKAFASYWSDAGSCANRLRTAAEALLTQRGIARTTLNVKRQRQPLTLHSRIEKYKGVDQEGADFLLAIKWIGNAGSHANLDALSSDDLLAGFELFEHVIEVVYAKRRTRLAKMAKAIAAHKGRLLRSKRKVPIWP